MRSATASPLRHEPGLDGVRAVCLAMAMLTHAGFAWAPGGFVGVSAFFTLSGFLITTLLLRAPADRRGLADFWTRRFRRLLPPVVLLVIGVLALDLLVDLGPPHRETRTDAMASLLYVANWRFLFTGNTYEAIFTAPSPFHHMWSLAIEEQFYLLFPLVVLGLARARLTATRIGPAMAVLWLIAVGSNLWTGAVHGVDATYLATQARLSELLAGAALATLWPGLLDAGRPRGHARHVVKAGVSMAALAGAAILIGLFVTVRDSDPLLARGLLPVVSLASTAVVAGVLVVPLVARAVSWGPLPLIGRLSYGLYLFHWPIFVWLDPARTGLDPVPLFAVRVAVTGIVAAASYRFVETPIRRAAPWARGARLAVPALACVVVVVALIVVPAGEDASVVEAAEAELATLLDARPPGVGVGPADARLSSSAALVDPAGPASAAEAAEPVVAAVFGDSTAFFTQLGLARWARAHPAELSVVEGSTKIGCPLGRGGRRDFQAGEVAPGPECDWTTRWPALTRGHRPDIAVVQVGPWEVADYRRSPDDEWTRIGDARHDAYLRAELVAAVDALLEGAAHVVLLTSPDVEVGLLDPQRAEGAIRASEPVRMDRFNRMLEDVARADDRVTVVDLAGHVAAAGDASVDTGLLPDGLHFTGDTAEVVAAWLAPAVVDAARTAGASGR